jgi:hypothetical protein
VSDKLYFSLSLAEFHYLVLQLGFSWAVRDATAGKDETAATEKFAVACKNLLPEIEKAYRELGPESADRFMRRLLRSAKEVWGDEVRIGLVEGEGPMAPAAKGAMPS